MRFFKRGSDKAGPGEGAADQDAKNQRRLRLLVVDEDATALAVMGRRLAHRGNDVVLAENGIVALTLMQAQRFDLILMDMQMPLLSGIDTMKKMRASGMLGNAAIMLISGRSDNNGAIEALAEGADDHIVKPFDFDVLEARIRHIVGRAEQMHNLVRHNGTLDARIARRAVELGETRAELEELHADRVRLVQSIQSLHDELQRLSAGLHN